VPANPAHPGLYLGDHAGFAQAKAARFADPGGSLDLAPATVLRRRLFQAVSMTRPLPNPPL